MEHWPKRVQKASHAFDCLIIEMSVDAENGSSHAISKWCRKLEKIRDLNIALAEEFKVAVRSLEANIHDEKESKSVSETSRQ